MYVFVLVSILDFIIVKFVLNEVVDFVGMVMYDSIRCLFLFIFVGSIIVSEIFYRSFFLVFFEFLMFFGILVREIRYGVGRNLVFCWFCVGKDVEIDVIVLWICYNFFIGGVSDNRRDWIGVVVKGVEFVRSISSVGWEGGNRVNVGLMVNIVGSDENVGFLSLRRNLGIGCSIKGSREGKSVKSRGWLSSSWKREDL